MKNTMKTMMAVAAFALAVGNAQAQQTFAQSFENAIAAQAKIDYDFEQALRDHYGLPNGKGMVFVSSHHASVSADYDHFWTVDHDLNARIIALWGLIINRGSEYFEATISDSQAEGRAFIQRPADEQALQEMFNQALQEGSKKSKTNSANSEVAKAEAGLQKVWDALSASTKASLRAEERAWIKEKDAISDPVAKVDAIQRRLSYLVDVGARTGELQIGQSN